MSGISAAGRASAGSPIPHRKRGKRSKAPATCWEALWKQQAESASSDRIKHCKLQLELALEPSQQTYLKLLPVAR